MTPFLDHLYAPRPAWFDHAACAGADTNLFFPTAGEGNTEATAICARCPVSVECRQAGANEHHGIWGGVSARARHRTVTVQPHGTPARYNTGCRCRLCGDAKAAYRQTWKASRGAVA